MQKSSIWVLGEEAAAAGGASISIQGKNVTRLPEGQRTWSKLLQIDKNFQPYGAISSLHAMHIARAPTLLPPPVLRLVLCSNDLVPLLFCPFLSLRPYTLRLS